MSSMKARSSKTLQRGNKENCKPTVSKKSKLPQPVASHEGKKIKAKPVPDFSKLHDQWQHKLQMGKACVKKPCTVSQEFNLTKAGAKVSKEVSKVKASDLSDDDRKCFTPDAKSMNDLKLNRELSPDRQTGRVTIATSRVASEKGRQPTANRQHDRPLERRPPAKRSKLSSLSEEQDRQGLQFESDNTALASILTNSGIDNQHPSTVSNKQFPRSSIYYQPKNRQSLFDSCLKKRLMSASNEVKRILESDRVCTAESPLVMGPKTRSFKNSVYPEYSFRTFQTPTTPKPDQPSPVLSVQRPNTAGRVPNPQFKPGLSQPQCSNSVKRIRKTLRWGDILASPEHLSRPRPDQVGEDDVTPNPLSPSEGGAGVPRETLFPPTSSQRSTHLTGVQGGESETGTSRAACRPGEKDDSLVTHLSLLHNTGSTHTGTAAHTAPPPPLTLTSSSIGTGSLSHLILTQTSSRVPASQVSLTQTSTSGVRTGLTPHLCLTQAASCGSNAAGLPGAPPSSEPQPQPLASSQPTPGHAAHQDSRSAAAAVPGVSAVGAPSVSVGLVASSPAGTAMIDVVACTRPDNVSCKRQLQCVEERQLLQEMQQLSMVMSDQRHTDDNDNNHHHHPLHQPPSEQQDNPSYDPLYPTSQSIRHQLHQQQLLHQHPQQAASAVDPRLEVLQQFITPFSNQPGAPNPSLPSHTVTSSASAQSSTLPPSSTTQGIDLNVPSNVNLNLNLALPSTSLDQPAPRQEMSPHAEQLQHQLLSVRQYQQELLRYSQQLEQQLQERQISRGPSGLQVHSDQSASNNNTDLKCIMSSIPPQTGPVDGSTQQQSACRQEGAQIKSGDINDNYQLPSTVFSTDAESSARSVNITEAHAGHGQTTEGMSSSSACLVLAEDTLPESHERSSEDHQSLQRDNRMFPSLESQSLQQPPSSFHRPTRESGNSVTDSVRRNSSAPLDLRTPCKLPRVDEDQKLPTHVDTTKTHLHVHSESHVPQTTDTTSCVLPGESQGVSKSPVPELSMPTPHRPAPEVSHSDLSPEPIMPPIWTPLALKVAASRTSPKGDDSNVQPSLPSTDSDDSKDSDRETESVVLVTSCSISRDADTASKATTSSGTSVVKSDHKHFSSKASPECKDETSLKQVDPVSLNVVTTSLTSVTISESLPLPAKQSHCAPSDLYLDALLDEECALFTWRIQTYEQDFTERDRGVENPVARTLSEGDDMHFVPIKDETPSPVEGSAFAAYSPV